MSKTQAGSAATTLQSKKKELPFRQIHLDFHTHQLMQDVGGKFDPETYSATLKNAGVASVTTFSRCHHGYLYYHSKRMPERQHPNLSRNLLKDQIEACHAKGIRVPLYTTVQWDLLIMEEHPEWLQVKEDGAYRGTPLFVPGFYRPFCMNTPYSDWLKEHIADLFESVPVDAIFMDFTAPQDCCCPWCRRGMIAEGLEPSNELDRRRYGLKSIIRWQKDMAEFCRQISPDTPVTFNDGHVGPRHREMLDTYSHFELESLPSGHWGYIHFPITARYARTLGKEILGMTGKFHTVWGDFHGFKNKEALQYECFRMLATGAKCSIGDQLLPSGVLDPYSYDLIGSVYSEVEKKEPWCLGVKAVTDIAIMTPEEGDEMYPLPPNLHLRPEFQGVIRMLEAGAQQYDIIDSHSDFSNYKVLVLPDTNVISDKVGAKLDQFVASGGKLIVSNRAGLDETGSRFTIKSLGIKFKGEAPFGPDFLIPQGEIGKGLNPTEYVMGGGFPALGIRAAEIEPEEGSEVLCEVATPYYNRTYRTYMSHQHFPSSGQVGYPGIIRNQNVIYFAHPIFTQYHKNAPKWCKTLFLNALDILLPDPAIRHEGPSTVQLSVNEQQDENRYVVHALHYIPERRSSEFDTIEDIIPVFDLKLSVRVPSTVKSVTCVPENVEIPFETSGDRIDFVLPKLYGHQMIALQLS